MKLRKVCYFDKVTLKKWNDNFLVLTNNFYPSKRFFYNSYNVMMIPIVRLSIKFDGALQFNFSLKLDVSFVNSN